MKTLALGIVAGVAISLSAWRPTVDPHHLSVFPDGLSALTLVFVLLIAAILLKRKLAAFTQQSFRRSNMLVATVAGGVFGTFCAVQALLHFEKPMPSFALFGFTVAFVSCVAVGACITIAMHRVSFKKNDAEAA